MLLEVKIKNFRSIRQTVIFSTLCANIKDEKVHVIDYDDKQFLKISAIYGANGSGKSNFINAIAFAKNLIVNSLYNQPGDRIELQSHKLAKKDETTEMSFHFEKNGIHYQYGFSILNQVIDEEFLYYYPNGRQAMIFDRKMTEVKFGKNFVSDFSLSLNALQDNRLFLSSAANFSSNHSAKEAFLFFKEDIIIYKPALNQPRMNNWYEYSVRLMESDPSIKNEFLKILKHFDTDIKDVKSKITQITNEDLEKFPEPIKTMAVNQLDHLESYSTKVIYEQFKTDLQTEESSGIKKLFEIICPMIDIINHDKVLFYDEFESGLHEAIVSELIRLFYEKNSQSKAQLIFTTHDTSLLNKHLFRRDQIWFTELKKEDRSTDLYSLVEIRNVRKEENKEYGYIKGKYGAIPFISENFDN